MFSGLLFLSQAKAVQEKKTEPILKNYSWVIYVTPIYAELRIISTWEKKPNKVKVTFILARN